MTEIMDFQKLEQSPPLSHEFTPSSEGALGSCEYKSSPTDVVKVRHVLKQSTSDSCTFEISVKLYSQMYYSKYLAF